MNVSACIVTRGDQELWPCIEPLQNSGAFSEILVWDNGAKEIKKCVRDGEEWIVTTGYGAQDLTVYGRYAAIEHTDAELIYVQDDDCVVSDPQAIVRAWHDANEFEVEGRVADPRGFVVCNMLPEFRHDFYEEHALVGFGACFHRDAPERAFGRFCGSFDRTLRQVVSGAVDGGPFMLDDFKRTCDIVFTALTPRVLVDVPVKNLWWAEDETRMYRQPQHVAERTRMLELVRKVRDA